MPATTARSSVNDPERPPTPVQGATSTSAGTDDWVTAAVVFAILGGCVALWVADLSLVTGGLAAMASAVFGVLFADW